VTRAVPGHSPHVSEALRRLRRDLTAAGVVLAACLLLQTLCWGFVHFTDVRTTTLEAPAEPSALVVQGGESPDRPIVEDAPAAVNTVASAADPTLRRVVALTQTVGVLSAVLLAILGFQAVTVAGGGRLPGVHMAVTAGTWGLVIAGLCIPWGGMLPDMAFSGVFGSYQTMVAESSLQRAGAPGTWAIGFYGKWFVLPLLLIPAVGAVIIRMRLGVESGIIVTHASQLDEKLEREIRDRKLGELSQPRAVGALNQAIGHADEVEEAPPPEPMAPPPAPPPSKHAPMSSRPDGGTGGRPI
jgi:hypothetical protein